jgi:hypothetical protein
MGEVVFIDTSVFVNLLDVPQLNADRAVVVKDFTVSQRQDATFVLPVTTIIETGNHIAQISGRGDVRHDCAQRFVGALKAALAAQPPWVLAGHAWDGQMIDLIVHGAGQRPEALLLLCQGIGTGDIGILAEVDAYRRRVPSATPVRIWTLDAGLAAYS